MKKVVIFGEGAVGKTSIVLTSFFGHNFNKIQSLSPTKGISIERVDFRGLERFNVWDCGGQEKYMQTHFSEAGKERIFSDINIAIFVMDASREETLDPVYVDRFLEILIEYNPDLNKVYIFVNKMDIAPKNINELQMRLAKNIIEKWGDGKFVEIVNCSVKFGSAREKFIHILDSVMSNDPEFIDKRKFFAGCLADFREVVNGNFFLFHLPSKLSIAELVSENNIGYFPYMTLIDMIIQNKKNADIKIYHQHDASFAYLKISQNIGLIIMVEKNRDINMNMVTKVIQDHDTFKDLKKILTFNS